MHIHIQKLRLPIAGAITALLLSMASMVGASGGTSTAPTAPTNLHSVTVTTQPPCSQTPCPVAIGMAWKSNSGGESVTSYKVFRNGVLETSVAASAAPSYTTQGAPGTTYTFVVQAVNSFGSSPNSNTLSVTTAGTAPAPTTVPTAPSGLITSRLTQPACVQAPCPAVIGVQWDPNPAAQSVTAYRVFQDGALVATVTASSAPSYATNVASGSTHTFFVQAVNSVGTSPSSNTISVTAPGNTPPAPTSAPTAPSGLTASRLTQPTCIQAPCPKNIGVQWNPNPASESVTSYQVFEDSVLVATVTASTTSYVTSAAASSTHTFFIRAINSVGTSPSSNTVTVVAPAP